MEDNYPIIGLFFLMIMLTIQSCTSSTGTTEPDKDIHESFTPPSPSKILWPFDNSTVPGNWFVTRGHGVATHKQSDYYALDYSVSDENECLGKPFHAPFDGRVVFSSPESQDDETFLDYGNQVILQSSIDTTFALRVAHFSSTKVFEGDEVKTGTVLGLVGSTGNSTGCHAHIVLYRNIYTGVMYDYDLSEIPAIELLGEGESINASLEGFPKEVFATPFEFVTHKDSIVFIQDAPNL